MEGLAALCAVVMRTWFPFPSLQAMATPPHPSLSLPAEARFRLAQLAGLHHRNRYIVMCPTHWLDELFFSSSRDFPDFLLSAREGAHEHTVYINMFGKLSSSSFFFFSLNQTLVSVVGGAFPNRAGRSVLWRGEERPGGGVGSDWFTHCESWSSI